MVRMEFVLAGCILVVAGLFAASTGYDKIQPTTLERLSNFARTLSGSPPPSELRFPKTEGYVLLVLGGCGMVGGLALILKSRK